MKWAHHEETANTWEYWILYGSNGKSVGNVVNQNITHNRRIVSNMFGTLAYREMEHESVVEAMDYVEQQAVILRLEGEL